MVLYDVQSESEVQQICSALTQIFNLPFDLHNGHQTTMTLSIGYAMTIEHASAENYKSLPITICIRPNTSVPKSW